MDFNLTDALYVFQVDTEFGQWLKRGISHNRLMAFFRSSKNTKLSHECLGSRIALFMYPDAIELVLHHCLPKQLLYSRHVSWDSAPL